MSEAGRPWFFVALVFAFAVPFWILGWATGASLLPSLPIAALMAVCPALAALTLVSRDGGPPAVRALLARAFDARRWPSLLWLVPALAITPAIRVVEFAIARLQGLAIPYPQFGPAEVVGLSGLFLLGAIAEELGWSGYAIAPLQARMGALGASLALGGVWAMFHFIPLGQAHRSLAWIAWWTLGTVATRVIMVWLFNATGRSVLATSLYHMSQNLSWQLYPVHGSFYDPRTSSLVMAAVALLIVIATRGRLARSLPA